MAARFRLLALLDMPDSPDFGAYDEAMAWLFGRINYERSPIPGNGKRAFKLDRMRRLLAELGDPQEGLRIVHLAGTKGKGSTAAMIASALRCAGLRTGLYTSPHLSQIEERFQVDGVLCTAEELVALTNLVRGAVERLDTLGEAWQATFFEITTAMALLHFVRRQVDAAVLETGLGGRLDSTNVCRPAVTAITSISYDHTQTLGATLAAIAGEKAGIIKSGVPIISGVVEPEPRTVIANIARQRQAPLIERGEQFHFRRLAPLAGAPVVGERIDYWEQVGDQAARLDDALVGMLGEHQAANAAVALAALHALRRQGWPIEEAAMRGGLAEARCPARVEILSLRPTVIIDAAHNVASVAALAGVLQERFPKQRRTLLFAAARDKDARGMLAALLPWFDRVVLTQFLSNPRSCSPWSLHQMAEELLLSDKPHPGQSRRPLLEIRDDPYAAWHELRRGALEEDLLCVTGSFFLAAEIRPLAAGCPTASALGGPTPCAAPRTVG